MNILAFFAHPDDETMLAGGALALLAQSGAHVHFLCATRGEGGEVGEPPAGAMDELGDVREQEMVCAVRTLGGRSLTFLGHTDPRVGPDDTLYPYTEDLVFLAGQVAATIRQLQADVLLTHGSNGASDELHQSFVPDRVRMLTTPPEALPNSAMPPEVTT